jgi:hypothetical protein
VYKTHCHSECLDVQEISPDTLVSVGILSCAAVAGNNGKCKLCRHSWMSHIQVMHELGSELTTSTDPKIKEKLQELQAKVEAKEAAIKVCRERINGLYQELEQVEGAAAQFGLSLGIIAIMPYNDEVLAYLDKWIMEGENISISSCTPRDRLGNFGTREEYKQRVRVLEQAVRAGGSCHTATQPDIEQLVMRLCSLEYCGPILKEILAEG